MSTSHVPTTSEFALDDSSNSITGIAINSNDNKIVEVTLSNALTLTSNVSISYFGTSLQDTSGNNASTTSEVRSGILRAWINFDGYGASIRASYNIASVTDNCSGYYTIFIDTDFTDSNYCWTAIFQ